MNKMIKGSTAGAIGVVLLMGGFGTYALWQDNDTLGAATINSGGLDITSAGGPTWAWGGGGVFTPASDLIVPGDVVVSNQTFDITGTGTNLTGVITFAPGALSNNFSDYLTYDVEITGSDDLTVVPAADDEFAFASPFGDETLTAVVTYTFDADTPHHVAQSASSILEDASITIAQN